MSKHTPEPWELLDAEGDKEYLRIRGTVLGGRYKIANVLWPNYSESAREREAAETLANAERIIDCVNACAGMADPAAEIAELKRQRDAFQLEAINCHEMLCVEIERTTNLIAELGFVSEYATKSVIGFCKGDEKSIFDFSKFMEGIFNRYDIELSTECEALLNEGKFTKPKNNLN